MSAQASVTIPYSEFQAIQDARRDSDRKIVELTEQIRHSKIDASDPTLLIVAREALEVARYAVASLPAESNKNWPGRALRSIAKHLPSMPDATADDLELASTFIYFADEIDLYEKRRQGITVVRVGASVESDADTRSGAHNISINDALRTR